MPKVIIPNYLENHGRTCMPCYIYVDCSREREMDNNRWWTEYNKYTKYIYFEFKSYAIETWRGDPPKRWRSIGIIYPKDGNNNEIADFSIEEELHWYTILWECIGTSKKDGKKQYVYLLNAFTTYNLGQSSVNALSAALAKFRNYPDYFNPCLEIISEVGKLASYRNQTVIKDLLNSYGYEYIIEDYRNIKEIANNVGITDNQQNKLNVFELIRCILQHHERVQIIDNNEFSQILYWLNNENGTLNNDAIILNTFAYFGIEWQLKIVKRYFFDILHHRRELSIDLLEALINPPNAHLESYRHNIYSFQEPFCICVKLLLDAIITYKKKQCFTSFNGLIDLWVREASRTYHQVSFGEIYLFPLCDGGVRESQHFAGFVSLRESELIEIDEDKINKLLDGEIIQDFIKTFYNPTNEYLGAQFRAVESSTNVEEWMGTDPYWVLDNNNREYVTYFSHIFGVNLPNMIYEEKPSSIKLEYPDSLIKKNLSDFLNERLISEESSWYNSPNSQDKLASFFIEHFMRPSYIGIRIREDVELGSVYQIDNDKLKERVRTVIQAIEGIEQPYKDKYRVKYSAQKFQELCTLFYIKDKDADESIARINAKISECNDRRECEELEKQLKTIQSYLIKYNPQKGTSYICAPNLSNRANPFIDSPYLWCRNRRCYYSSLNLSDNNHWPEYNFIDIMHIMGVELIESSSLCKHVSEEYRLFIDHIHKVKLMIDHLTCDRCGHVLFPDRNRDTGQTDFYKYYRCINERCSESRNRQSIYLNFCFNCKEGIIDDRRSKRCPNNFVICPKCLSCCSNDSIQRMTARKLIQNGFVPEWLNRLRGKGHNDVNIKYCPRCGNQLDQYTSCPKCGYVNTNAF